MGLTVQVRVVAYLIYCKYYFDRLKHNIKKRIYIYKQIPIGFGEKLTVYNDISVFHSLLYETIC